MVYSRYVEQRATLFCRIWRIVCDLCIKVLVELAKIEKGGGVQPIWAVPIFKPFSPGMSSLSSLDASADSPLGPVSVYWQPSSYQVVTVQSGLFAATAHPNKSISGKEAGCERARMVPLGVGWIRD